MLHTPSLVSLSLSISLSLSLSPTPFILRVPLDFARAGPWQYLINVFLAKLFHEGRDHGCLL